MKTRVFFVLAAMALLAGCAKEIQAPVEMQTGEPFVLQVGINNPEAELESEPAQAPTRTYLGDAEEIAGINHYHVYWSNGDRINVNGKTSDALADIAASTAKTSFAFTENGAPAGTSYKILYPAGIYDDDTHVNLPAVQTYKAGGFADGMFPMAGYSSDGSGIKLSHLCAILKISVLQETTAHAEARGGSVDSDNISCIRFKGRNNEKVSGNFEIAYNPAGLKAADGTGAELEVRVAQSKGTSTSTPVDYYIVVPARAYSNGFDVIVQDSNGHIMTKSKTSSKTLEAGHLYAMTAFEFVPTQTELGITISTAEELVNFATAYNNKTFQGMGNSLVATLTNNITFDATSSAAFNATKGIGLKTSYYEDAEDFYFDGVFKSTDGENFTISGLEANVPLFKATNSNSLIKDITIASTCSFTFTHSKVAELDAGAVVGYHRGTLKNVNVAADVSLTAVDAVNKVTELGGLVGRVVVGTVDNCTYSGNLVIPAGFNASDQVIYIGGLVGGSSNASGKVKDSQFQGTIDNQGQMIASSEADDFKNNPQLIIGGIIGLNTGTIDHCTVANHATGVTVTLNDGSDHNYTGTVVTHSTNAYHYAIAGIAGRNDGTVKDCTNNATVVNIFSAGRGDGGNMNGRYLEVGGIVGYNSSSRTVSGCTNNGSIINRANPKMQRIGGVVGWNYGTVSSCKNESTGSIGVGTSHTSPYSARQLYLGGVIGGHDGGSLSNVQNAGALTVSRLEGNDAMTYIGGVIGSSSSAIDGTAGKLISNSGNISQSNTCTKIPANGYNLGGVVGYASKSITNVNNTGTVSFTKTAGDTGTASAAGFNLGGVVGKTTAAISSSTNSGRVYMTNSTTGVSTNGGYNLGGIAGVAGSTITGCSNSGKVDYTVSAAVAYTAGFNIGGIAGVNNGAVSTSPNSGEVYFANSSTGSATGGYNVGGIVGAANANITDSDNTGYIHHAHTGTAATTNIHIGGVAGYMAKSATISGCDNSTSAASNSGSVCIAFNTGYAHTGNSIGGILGCTPSTGVNATIEGCNNNGKIYGGVNSAQHGYPLFVGGIVAYVAGASSISDCDNSGETWNNQTNNTYNNSEAVYNGGIAGYVEGTAEGRIAVSDCDVTSSLLHSRRGFLGGVIGYSNYADIESCTFNQNIVTSNNYTSRIGGIAGFAENSKFTSCTFSGTELSGTTVADNQCGGIVGILGVGCLVDACNSYLTTIYGDNKNTVTRVGGGIAGTAEGTPTIRNSHWNGTINGSSAAIVGTGDITDGGGNDTTLPALP